VIIGVVVGIGTVTILRNEMAWPWYVLVGSVVTFVAGSFVGLFESQKHSV